MPFTLAFPDYAPDQPALAGVMAQADNVLPGPNGYRPLARFVALTASALPGYPLGAATFTSAARKATTFAGTASTLYVYGVTAWLAVGSGYTATDDNPWTFVQFGQRIIATNGIDPPQYYDLDVSTAFAPLPGESGVNPPAIKLLAVVRDFVFGGVVNGDASRVQWSGINDSSGWRPTYGQSDYNIAAAGGEITAIAGGEYGLIFQQERISRATYVAGNVIFQFDEISPNIGCIHPRSFCQVGRMTFFLSARGFMQCDGSSVTPIGDEKVDQTFLNGMNRTYMHRMSCIADPFRKVIYWTQPQPDPTIWFAYSWALQRWSRVVQPARLLVASLTTDATLDQTIGTNDAFDDAGLPLDDDSYIGGGAGCFLFDGTNMFGGLTGTPMPAALSTALMEPAPGQCVRTSRVRPMTDAVSGLSLTLDARPRLGDAPNPTVYGELTVEGDMPALRRGRYMAATLAIGDGAAWTFAKGLSVEGRAEGALR